MSRGKKGGSDHLPKGNRKEEDHANKKIKQLNQRDDKFGENVGLWK